MARFVMYCWKNGAIEIGRDCPDGALPLGRGTKKLLKEIREVAGRWAYKQKESDPQVYLVPGVPEARTDEQRVLAAKIFRDLVLLRLKMAKGQGVNIPREKAAIYKRYELWYQSFFNNMREVKNA